MKKTQPISFKPGDWVIDTTDESIGRILDDAYYIAYDDAFAGPRTYRLDFNKWRLQPWQPKEDEWCWFRDNETFTPVFGQLLKTENDTYIVSVPNGHGALRVEKFKHCTPFIGDLPELKV